MEEIKSFRRFKQLVTLYIDLDGYLTVYKDEQELGTKIFNKGSIWELCSKEEYCTIQNYCEEDTEEFMDDSCDYDFVMYNIKHTSSYLLVNGIDYDLFEKV